MLAQEPSGDERLGNYASVAKEENGQGSHRKLWAPFFLRRPIMVVFLFSFLSLFGTLIALYVYTQRQGRSLGIKTDGDRYYYLWTYGLTAVFTILTAGWMQAEYRAAQLMPWILMHQGPTPASQSIFLDYMSKWNVVSLYQSLKQKHFLVSLCVAGSLLLNGVTVFSTGLFELDSVPITRPSSLTVPKAFSEGNYRPTVYDSRSYAACSAFAAHNLTRPFGLHEPYIYTPFQPASSKATGNNTIPIGPKYQAEIEVIEPFLDCQNGTVTWTTGRIPSPNWNGTGDQPDVERNTTMWSAEGGCDYKIYPSTLEEMLNKKSVSIEMHLTACGGESANAYAVGKNLLVDWTVDWRLWAAVINPASAKLAGNEVLRSPSNTPPIHLVVCKPRYNAYRGPVKIWREPGQSAISAYIQSQSLKVTEGIANVSAANILHSSFRSLSLSEGNGGPVVSDEDFHFTGHEGTSQEVYWNDMAAFTDAMRSEFSCLMRQVVQNELLYPNPHNVEGTEQFIEERLFVRPLSFWLMAALLGFLITIAIILLFFFVPVAVCPRDTGSIGGMTAVFAQSPEFMASFKESQLKTESQMADTKLGQTLYTSSHMEGTFRLLPQIEPADTSASEGIKSSERDNSSTTWWYPFSSTWFIRVAVVILPVAVIISLEVVYHISASTHGITLVDGKSPYIHYIWTYIPALVMFIIRVVFASVEFGARIVQPYARLREGSAPPQTTIFENQLRKIALYGVFDNLRQKQWTLAAATTSLLLAAINPIVVSGLYTAKASWPTSPMNITQTTRWNLGDPTRSDKLKYSKVVDFNTDKMAGLIIHLNMTDPQWTYNNLAFPQFALLNTVIPPGAGYIDVRIPALRSQLACKHAPINCSAGATGYFCKSDDPCYEYGMGSNPVEDTTYFIQGTYLLPAKNATSNCSTDNILYGDYGYKVASPENYLLNCNATIEEVDVDTRLQLPSFSIDADIHPRIVPNTTRKVFNTTINSFPSLSTIDNYLFKTNPNVSNILLSALTDGIHGVPAKELLDPPILAARLNTVWGIIMAQLFNSNGRESFDDPLNTTWFVEPATSHAPIYEGVFHDGRKYLVQSEISTRILDGVLGTMVICALAVLCVMRTKEVLPKSPCSIASVASLVAESRFLELLRGTEYSDAELRKRGLFEGVFSMGWWEVERKMSQSDFSTSSGSSVSSVGDEGQHEGRGSAVERGNDNTRVDDRRTRFGIDIDGNTPLLRDVS
ncbi:Protein of unknown function DUF3433 [Penicillium expansum]|uniref:Uncharacterized protein n=1 Tax=Penicillium expansum TaxID=27334 RepID=A0A0A2KGQ1_PENEN|nr:Protein of unknown function DUF3433 [Penicillium expansum]KGO56618.1 Protein of unknown function DUF3433 [Penicillium expansum]KGO66997.1 Protein of unknown function DUF3433 [Penicillium expansum]